MPRATEFLGANCLNVRDLQEYEGNELIGTVASVDARTLGDKQKLIVYLDGITKGLALNQDNLHAMLEIAGGEDDTDRWAGLEIRVFIDPSVQYMGRRVGGIRVEAAPETDTAEAGK